jgi:RNA polymerase sigma-70 factor (ECF subfamily)
MDGRADDLAELLARVALGERTAFERLYRATCDHLLGVAYQLLGNRSWAEDVLQEAYVSVWHGARGYQAGLARPMTWLIHVVRHRAIDALRSRHGERKYTEPLQAAHEEVADAGTDGPAQCLAASLARVRIDHCMAGLAPGQRQALALAYYRGLVHSEIAQALNAPLGTAKAWVRRGLDRLRDCLAAAGVEEAT